MNALRWRDSFGYNGGSVVDVILLPAIMSEPRLVLLHGGLLWALGEAGIMLHQPGDSRGPIHAQDLVFRVEVMDVPQCEFIALVSRRGQPVIVLSGVYGHP